MEAHLRKRTQFELSVISSWRFDAYPYFEFKLGNKRDYLGSITVGPNPHPDLANDSVQMLLGKYGVANETKIFETGIPFRNW